MKKQALPILLTLYVVLTIYFMQQPGLITSIEKTDIDKPFYTEQMQNLLLGKETIFMHPSYRALSPFISIGISTLTGLDYIASMQTISFTAGLLTILFLWFFFYKLTLSEQPTEEEIWTKRFFITGLYATSASIIMFSGTYYIDTLSTLFAFMLIYFTHKSLTTDNFRYPLFLAITFILSVANKETSLSYIVIMVAYAFFVGRHKLLFYLSFIPAVIWYYIQYTLLYGQVKHLIIPSVFTEYMVGYNGSFLGTITVHFVSLWDNLILFFSSRIPLLGLCILFSFGVMCVFVLQAYYKIIVGNFIRKTNLLISHLLVAGISFLWFIETTSPKFVYFLWAPILYILVAKYSYENYKSKVIRVIFINFILCFLFLQLYIITHQAVCWNSFFEIAQP